MNKHKSGMVTTYGRHFGAKNSFGTRGDKTSAGSRRNGILSKSLASRKNSTLSLSLSLSLLVALVATACSAGFTPQASAATFQQSMDVVFTFKPKLTFTSSASELLIDDLVPGTAADSNVTNISISTSSTAGYSLYATVGSTDNASTNLVKASSSNTFTNLSTNAATLNDIADNTWGYTYSTDSGSTWKSGNTGSTNTGYNGLPIYTAASGVLLADASTNSQTDLQFKVGAKAGEDQPAGAYTNDITFNAVAKLLTTNYTITYNDPSNEATNMPAAYTGVASNGIFFLTDTTPSRTDYTFDGWCSVAPTNDNECSGTTYSPGSVYTLASVSSTQNVTVYAMWKNNFGVFGIGTMQEMTPEICAAAAVGDSASLKDTRDNEVYLVSKLADGNCWLLDNLRLGGDSTIELTSADTNISSSYTLPASVSGDSWSNSYTASYINTGSKNTTTTSYGSGSGKIGVYYNYCAASAGTYCYDSSSGTSNASYDICPKGWRMPTGGSSGEYKTLYTSYSSDASSFLSALSIPLSGNYDDGSAGNRGSVGYFWSSTYRNSTNMYGLYVLSSDVYPTDNDYRYVGSSIRCIAHKTATQPTITYNNNGGTGTISSQTAASASEFAQSFTLSDGTGMSRSGYTLLGWSTNSNATTAEYTLGRTISTASDLTLYAVWEEVTYMQDFSCSSLASGATTTLVDSRDGESYLVGKLADGKCWMLDNLRLGGSSSIALTSADTNISSSYTLPASGSWSDSYTTSYINADYKNITTTSYGSGSGKIGVYYNYCAASAGTICSSRNESDASYDICPKGWRMPTGGMSDDSSRDYNTLYASYNGDTSSLRSALSTPLSGVYSESKGARQQGSSGYFSSSSYNTAYDTYYYMGGFYVASSNAEPYLGNRGNGFSIRCISSS